MITATLLNEFENIIISRTLYSRTVKKIDTYTHFLLSILDQDNLLYFMHLPWRLEQRMLTAVSHCRSSLAADLPPAAPLLMSPKWLLPGNCERRSSNHLGGLG